MSTDFTYEKVAHHNFEKCVAPENISAEAPPIFAFLLFAVLIGIISGVTAWYAGAGILGSIISYVVVGSLIAGVGPILFTLYLNRRSSATRSDPAFRYLGVPENEALDTFPPASVSRAGAVVYPDVLFEKAANLEKKDQRGGVSLEGPEQVFSALCIGKTDVGCDFHEFSYNLKRFIPQVSLSGSFNEAIYTLLQSPDHRQVLCLDIDHIDQEVGMPAAIDELLHLRKVRPNVPVILLSQSFLADEVSHHRSAIADASLRLPVEAKAISAIVTTALVNNSLFQSKNGSSVE